MTDLRINFHVLDSHKSYEYYDKSRSNFQNLYAELLLEEHGLRGRVLDIGCGHGVNPITPKLLERLGTMDGVDPFPVVEPPKFLANLWTSTLEKLPVPENTYDMAYSYNVVEHVYDVGSFLEKAVDVIKPGATYWSMSPNAFHPFSSVVLFMQRSGLKAIYQRLMKNRANDYPAFYRLSNYKLILAEIESRCLPIDQVDFYFVPNVQWSTYFPRRLRFIPKGLDSLIILRRPRLSFIFMFRIRKQVAK